MLPESVADAITNLIYRILNRKDAPVARAYVYLWLNANALDANLSDIQTTGGYIITGVPQLSSVGALVNSDPILCVKGPGIPLTIIGKIIGDVTAVIT